MAAGKQLNMYDNVVNVVASHKACIMFSSFPPTSVEHKLLVIGPTEQWSVREKLCLATSVMKSGDQNWYCATVLLKPQKSNAAANDYLLCKELDVT